MTMAPEDIEAHFQGADGQFRFARWGRPVAPIVFGVDDKTVSVFKGAFEALSALTQHPLAETDPELGLNLMCFVFRDWAELLEIPDLDKLVPELGTLVPRLEGQQASQYRLFRFDEGGGVKAAFVFIRLDEALERWPAESLALAQAVQVFLLWGDSAFAARSPLARLESGAEILRPEVGDLLRAAYAPELPNASADTTLALRLYARMQASHER